MAASGIRNDSPLRSARDSYYLQPVAACGPSMNKPNDGHAGSGPPPLPSQRSAGDDQVAIPPPPPVGESAVAPPAPAPGSPAPAAPAAAPASPAPQVVRSGTPTKTDAGPPTATRKKRWKHAPDQKSARQNSAKSRTSTGDADPESGEEAGEDDRSWWQRARQYVVDSSPPWAVSFIFHLLLVLILALLTIPNPAIQTVLLVLDPSLATEEGLEDDDVIQQEMTELDVETPEISFDEIPVDDPLAAMPEIELDLAEMAAAADIQASSIGAALTGREEGNKQALLAKYGGTRTTEEAVVRALAWIARQQRRDGSWSLSGPYSNGALADNRVAATAMALLAFQGAGITPTRGKYKDRVAKGARALLKMQADNGMFRSPNGPRHQQLYAHAQGMIAICELYGMTKNSRYKVPAEKAIEFAVKNQAAEGGWRYQIGIDSDLSVTGWFLMGLQSARMAGLKVPKETLYRVTEFLDELQTRDGARYRYRIDEGVPTPSMSAEGLLCRQYLGWKQDDPRLVRGVRNLVERTIDFSSMNVYYWYYATQVCHHQGGEPWDVWNAVMREKVPQAQIKSGKEKGSWDPRSDAWGNLGGRLYTTCLCTYMLEVYYRHLPIYSYRKEDTNP